MSFISIKQLAGILTWIVWCPALLYAQHNQYQFSHLTINNGLSHNEVTAIFKDSRGFMWFGTMAGLNRYDGYKFKIYRHDLADGNSLNDDFIVSIKDGPGHTLWIGTRLGFDIYDPETEHFNHNVSGYLASINITATQLRSVNKDMQGNFMFLTSSPGIYVYHEGSRKTVHYQHEKNNAQSPDAAPITSVSADSQNNVWMVHNNGILEKFNIQTGRVSGRWDMLSGSRNSEQIQYSISIDAGNGVWVYSPGAAIGVFYLEPGKNNLVQFSKESVRGRLNSNIVNAVIQDDQGLIWISTDHGGINILNKKDLTVRYLVNREDDSKSVGQNSTISMYKDNAGIIWIGTYKKGISYYHENIIKFPLIRHHASDPNSLSYEDVNRFAEDEQGNLWIGTNGGGLIYFNRKTGKFTRYRHDASNHNSLSSDVVVSLCIDREQRLWIGTYFGGMDCFYKGKFTHYRHNAADPESISDDRVWEIMEDSDLNLWVGTLAGGLNRFDRKKNIFYHYKPGAGNTIGSLYTSAILEDKDGDLWLGTADGLDMLQKRTGKFKHYRHNDGNANSLIHNNISNLCIDSRGLIWIATREGLGVLDKKTGNFKNFRKEDGLPDNTIIDIQEDAAHNLWISTTHGLSNARVSFNSQNLKVSFKNYDETDGLQGLEFNESASLKTRKGELIFGGANGFNLFDPLNIRVNRNRPSLVFTDFQIFDKSVRPGEDINGHVILQQSVTESRSITLRYSENVFAIEFAALDFFNPDKVKLQYIMDGFNKTWLTADNKVRKASYTNLDPGTYTFKVRASNADGDTAGKELSLQVMVLPPFWRTVWAYIAYVLIAAGSLLFIRRRGIQKIRAQFALEQERQEAHRMHDLDMMKIKFFTNMSHEFRTPISLIMAPVDKILKQTEEPEHKRQLQMINRNARRLLNLVNQLLDFRKMEVQELRLHLRSGDIISFIHEIANSFADVAEKKNIGFLVDSETESLEAKFDHDKVERILFNLLSNSFKFTPEHGHVSVLVNVTGSSSAGQQVVEIKVIDTGIGIPHEKHERIFDRFFQNDIPGSMVNQGSGIGLAITKEFVKLHHGEITVESEPGQGSCFIVTLPVQAEAANNEEDVPVQAHGKESAAVGKVLPAGKKHTVLLVEDNDDFRFYLKDNLKTSYHIIEAANGKEGWQKALSLHPSLVVSDISMPEMNGIDLCKKIKADSRTSHIPVILLTALTGEEQQLKGLETGAADYMTKPFNFEILLSKLKNILLQQESMRKTYQKQVEVNPSEVVTESPDEKFIQKTLQLIEKNISNTEFSVEELSSEMYVSRVTLYKKILALTGKTPVELIRSVRMKRAMQLLDNGYLTVSQVSYKVGFKSQKYFVRSFKAEFDALPSEYLAKNKVSNPS